MWLGSAFTSSMMRQLCALLEVEIKYASVKHPQTIGVVELSQATLNRILHVYENNQTRDWHIYVDLAFSSTTPHITAQLVAHPAFSCMVASRWTHWTASIMSVDCETNQHWTFFKKHRTVWTQFLLVPKNTLIAYNKYRDFYDRKAKAQPLALHSYCVLLNPKLITPSDSLTKSLFKWLPLYRVEKVITNCNYIVRKVNTNNTQCAHRVMLRPIQPKYHFHDLDEIGESNFIADPITQRISEPSITDDALSVLLDTSGIVFPGSAQTTTNIVTFGSRAAPRAEAGHMQEPASVCELPVARQAPARTYSGFGTSTTHPVGYRTKSTTIQHS